MRHTAYVLKSAVGAYVEAALKDYGDSLNYLQVIPIEPDDTLEERPGLYDTHFKVFVDLRKDSDP